MIPQPGHGRPESGPTFKSAVDELEGTGSTGISDNPEELVLEQAQALELPADVELIAPEPMLDPAPGPARDSPEGLT